MPAFFIIYGLLIVTLVYAFASKKNLKSKSWILNSLVILLVGFVYIYAALGPTTPPSRGNAALKWVATNQVRAIALYLVQYSINHGGHYPEGKSSTEIFQHLIDEKYVTDPSVFYVDYVHMTGKRPPEGNQLKPENVCWDVTCGDDSLVADGLPLVYLSGYKVVYEPGSPATPIHPFQATPSTWYDWFYGAPDRKAFIAFAYTTTDSNKTQDASASSVEVAQDGSIPDFIPSDFHGNSKLYQQLTPDGIMSP